MRYSNGNKKKLTATYVTRFVGKLTHLALDRHRWTEVVHQLYANLD